MFSSGFDERLSSDERRRRAQRLARQFVRRPEAAEDDADANLIRRHPELSPELADELHKARVVQAAQDDAELEGFFHDLNKLRRPPDALRQTLRIELPAAGGDCGENQAAWEAAPGDACSPRAAADSALDIRVTAKEIDLPRVEPTAPDALAAPSADPHDPQLPPPVRFRPRLRPPVAVLVVLDDDGASGQILRIRTPSLVIGRSEGDFTLPDDAQISPAHAEIARQAVEGCYRWWLRDLQSGQGTFVQALSVRLKDGDEFALGERRFRFVHRGVQPQSEAADSGAPHLPAAVPPAAAAELIDISSGAPSPGVPLVRCEYWLGRDRRLSSPFIIDDPLVDPTHAMLYLGGDGRWHLKDTRSLNGVWIRVKSVPLTHGCSFRLGEQRFRFLLP